MFKLYSKGCEYAIRAMMHAGSTEAAERFSTKDVCEKAGIPESFTRKVFQALVQGGFLEAARGPGGGYELTKAPKDITLLEIIKAVDGEDTFEGCIMGLPQCGGRTVCPLHPLWAEAKSRLIKQLEETHLKDLIDASHNGAAGDEA